MKLIWAVILICNTALIFGAAYVIIWHDRSFWWMVLALFLQQSIEAKREDEK